MLSSLSDPILPIFAILALGYCLNRLGLFDVVAAQSINKFVFFRGHACSHFFHCLDCADTVEKLQISPSGKFIYTLTISKF